VNGTSNQILKGRSMPLGHLVYHPESSTLRTPHRSFESKPQTTQFGIGNTNMHIQDMDTYNRQQQQISAIAIGKSLQSAP
jgi:hypothetical protein